MQNALQISNRSLARSRKTLEESTENVTTKRDGTDMLDIRKIQRAASPSLRASHSRGSRKSIISVEQEQRLQLLVNPNGQSKRSSTASLQIPRSRAASLLEFGQENNLKYRSGPSSPAGSESVFAWRNTLTPPVKRLSADSPASVAEIHIQKVASREIARNVPSTESIQSVPSTDTTGIQKINENLGPSSSGIIKQKSQPILKVQTLINSVIEEVKTPLSPLGNASIKSSVNEPHSTTEEVVLIGTPVKKGHSNYTLIHDMLTGIRIAVSRYQNDDRQIQTQDFVQWIKIKFDDHGSETSSSFYDFKFKDYASLVFKKIRDAFNVNSKDYVNSLTNKYILSELGSPGKSGSFFYFTQDYRFIIKTISRKEHMFLRKILIQYYHHIKQNPNTLLSRILGLHRVNLPKSRRCHFVVMANLFPPNRDIHSIYDLKGSTHGRRAEICTDAKFAILKDLNWLENKEKLVLGAKKRAQLQTQLSKDVELLVKCNVMDYSFLVGIHDSRKGNALFLRGQSLKLVQDRSFHEPDKSSPTRIKRKTIADIFVITQQSMPEFGESHFNSDFGGFKSSSFVYYLGIIDIFTAYATSKKIEHFAHVVAGGKNFSCIPSKSYGERFLKFINDSMIWEGSE